MTDLHDTPRAEGPTCYLHIGMAKTGTSSIQKTLAENRDSTEFSYLSVGPANHSRVIYSIFSKTPASNFPYFKKIGWGDKKIARYGSRMRLLVESDLAANSHKKFIISGETIITFNEEQLVRLRDFLGIYFKTIKVVAYIRPPKSYMESIFQQRLKGDIRHNHFAKVYPFYQGKIEKFDTVFGRENVILRKYDPAAFPNGDVVMDFCDLTQISIPGYTSSRVNESLSLEAIALLYAYRKFSNRPTPGKEAVTRNRQIIAEMRKIPGKRFYFSNKLISSIYDQNRADLDWIECRAGFSVEPLSDDSPPFAISSPKDLLSYSMDGAQLLRNVPDSKFPGAQPLPQNPRKAARVLYDFTVQLDPKLEGTFPDRKFMRQKSEKPSPSPKFFPRLRKWFSKRLR